MFFSSSVKCVVFQLHPSLKRADEILVSVPTVPTKQRKNIYSKAGSVRFQYLASYITSDFKFYVVRSRFIMCKSSAFGFGYFSVTDSSTCYVRYGSDSRSLFPILSVNKNIYLVIYIISCLDKSIFSYLYLDNFFVIRAQHC